MTMAAIVTNRCLAPSIGLIGAILAALGVSAIAGTINGLGVSILAMSPIVMTLAMNGIEQGAVSYWVGGSGFITTPGSLSSFANGTTLGLPNVVWVWGLATGAIAVAALRFTVFGRALYATGSSGRVAWLSGVRCRSIVSSSYVISALVAGVTAFSRRYLVADLSRHGRHVPLPLIAAVVLGGVAITGGSGGYVGPLGGALAIISLDFLLSALGMSGQEQEVAFGCVLLLAVIAPRLVEIARERRASIGSVAVLGGTGGRRGQRGSVGYASHAIAREEDPEWANKWTTISNVSR